MHAPATDASMDRAEAAIREAQQLRAELDRQRAIGTALCRHARQSAILQSGLTPALAISLIEEKNAALSMREF